ncbi:paramyosin-like [Camellia sinensis]|uniref:paramyosin-like n=1 Tax=Camellia sinensis TaxID=4442 RepID=UPI001036B5E8|nr:paramyosin-like [Camellia sinensis]
MESSHSERRLEKSSGFRIKARNWPSGPASRRTENVHHLREPESGSKLGDRAKQLSSQPASKVTSKEGKDSSTSGSVSSWITKEKIQRRYTQYQKDLKESRESSSLIQTGEKKNRKSNHNSKPVLHNEVDCSREQLAKVHSELKVREKDTLAGLEKALMESGKQLAKVHSELKTREKASLVGLEKALTETDSETEEESSVSQKKEVVEEEMFEAFMAEQTFLTKEPVEKDPLNGSVSNEIPECIMQDVSEEVDQSDQEGKQFQAGDENQEGQEADPVQIFSEDSQASMVQDNFEMVTPMEDEYESEEVVKYRTGHLRNSSTKMDQWKVRKDENGVVFEYIATVNPYEDEIIAIQKNHIAHKRVLELRKTTRQAMAKADAKSAESKECQQKTAELEAEVTRLTRLVTLANTDKQKALAVMKDKYLRELAKLKGKKKAEITELEKKLEALGHGPETEVFNPPQYFIPSSLAEYTTTTQQQFLEDLDEEEIVPNDTPVVNDPACQSARSEPTMEDLTVELPTEIVLPTETILLTETELPTETGLRVELDADLDDLFS